MVYHPGGWASESVNDHIPRLGLGTGDTTHLAELSHFSEINDALGGLTIENLSQRNALNAYFGWDNAGEYLAPYNIPNSIGEQAEISAISESSPDALFLGPGTWHDGYSMTLRTPAVARWVMEHHKPVRCEGSFWAVPKGSKGLTAASHFPDSCMFSQTPHEVLEMWTEFIGAPSDLAFLPHSWARNRVDTTSTGAITRFRSVSEPGMTVWSALVNQEFVKKSDFLAITAKCSSGQGFQPTRFNENPLRFASAHFRWRSVGSNDWTQAINFHWGEGNFMVPLYAYPLWQGLASEPLEIQISAGNASCEGGWTISVSGETPITRK